MHAERRTRDAKGGRYRGGFDVHGGMFVYADKNRRRGERESGTGTPRLAGNVSQNLLSSAIYLLRFMCKQRLRCTCSKANLAAAT